MKKKIILLVLCAVLLLMFTSSSYGGFDPNYMEREEADPWEEMKSPSRDGTTVSLDEVGYDNIVIILIVRALADDFILTRGRSLTFSDDCDEVSLHRPPSRTER